MQFREKAKSSLIWKGVIRGPGRLKKGLRWQVLNGEMILFWLDAWLEDKPLCEVVVMPIREGIKQLKARDF